jgi:hypothetical protein
VLDYVQKHNLESYPPLLKNELAPEIRAIKENAKPQACSSFPIAPFHPKVISSEEVFLLLSLHHRLDQIKRISENSGVEF